MVSCLIEEMRGVTEENFFTHSSKIDSLSRLPVNDNNV